MRFYIYSGYKKPKVIKVNGIISIGVYKHLTGSKDIISIYNNITKDNIELYTDTLNNINKLLVDNNKKRKINNKKKKVLVDKESKVK